MSSSHTMKSVLRHICLAALLTVPLILSGCGGQEAPGTDTTQPPIGTEDAATTGEPEGGAPSTGRTFGPGSFDLLDPEVGLTDLTGYRATLTTTFDGTLDGQPVQWTRTYTFAASSDPPAQAFTLESSGTPEDEAASGTLRAEVEGVAFTQQPGSTCTAQPAGEETSSVWTPASVLPQVVGAEEAGPEPINGIETTRYTFDQRAVGYGTSAEGSVWIAQNGGYIVRYELTVEGVLGDNAEGTRTWAYEISDANQPVTVELPEDCPVPLTGVPLPEDAANIRRFPGLIRFDTGMDLQDVASFYSEQMPSAGWQPLGESAVQDDIAVVEFSQGEQALSVVARRGDTTTEVSVISGNDSAPAALTPTP